MLEALDETLRQLSIEEQEDVNSFLEATEERKADLKGTTGVDVMGRVLLEIGTLGVKGSLPVRCRSKYRDSSKRHV